MNILFLTLLDFSSVEESGIYTDLIREFIKKDHKVFIEIRGCSDTYESQK